MSHRLNALILALPFCSAVFAAPIQLSVSGAAASAHGFSLNGAAGAATFSFGPVTAGNLTVTGTVNASFTPQSVSLTLTDASFACPNGCGPNYGMQALLHLPFGMLPPGPLGVTVEVSGTATLDFPAIVEVQTFVGTIDQFHEVSQHALFDSGPFSLTPARADAVLPSYLADEPAYVAIGLYGLPGSYFQGELRFPDSMKITVTSLAPEPGTAVLLGATLAIGIGISLRRRRSRS